MSPATTVAGNRPRSTEHTSYFGKYIDLVPEHDVLGAMQAQLDEEFAFLDSIPESQANVIHAPYTWTIKQVISHLTDSERVFAYRALRFARGDATPLPGFEENDYAKTAETDKLSLRDLVEELETGRRAAISMFSHLPEAAWSRQGLASNNPASVRALAFVIVGHARHHLGIIRKRLNLKPAGGAR